MSENEDQEVEMIDLTQDQPRVVMMNNNPVKTWAMTLNNPTDAELMTLRGWTVEYRIIGHENRNHATYHLQCWITFARAMRFSAVKKFLPRAHWEHGKTKDGENYCMKDGDFEITDNRPKSNQGKRSDLEEVYDTIKSGGNTLDVINKHPGSFIKFSNGISKMMMQLQPKRDAPPEVTVIWGASGVGKSRRVAETEPSLYWVNHSGRWWDGYNGEEAVILDDFRGDWMKFHELLRLLDRYPTNVEIKGGYVTFNAKRIYITSDKDPRLWYNVSDSEYDQLDRRITTIMNMVTLAPDPIRRAKRVRHVVGVHDVEVPGSDIPEMELYPMPAATPATSPMLNLIGAAAEIERTRRPNLDEHMSDAEIDAFVAAHLED